MGLSLKVLGDFAVFDMAGASLLLPTKKTRALLGYLAANVEKPQQREKLIGLLWGNFGEKQARHSLNQAVMAIRKLGSEAGLTLLEGDGERITLSGNAIAIDLTEFRNRLPTDPIGATALYEGPFLDGLTIPDPAFNEWLTATRSEIHRLACNAMEQATDVAEEGGELDAATAIARRLVALDPLRESAHRRLMALLSNSGDRTAALRQFHTFAELLKTELYIEPESETKVLYESIVRRANSKMVTGRAELVMERRPNDIRMFSDDKPSIAVLPFANMSGDTSQDYLVDGIHLATYATLIKASGLFLVGGAHVSSYRQREFSAGRAGHDLKVRYLLEGAVQTAGRRLRVTVQLTDTLAERVIWAEQYDRVLNDFFALQDEIALEVLAELDIKLISGEEMRKYRSTLTNLEARDCYYRALSHFYANTKTDNAAARNLFKKVAALQPDSPEGPSFVCFTYWLDVFRGWTENADNSMASAVDWAGKASKFYNNNGFDHLVFAADHLLNRRYKDALQACAKAYAYRPNCPMASGYLANILHYCGEPRKAILKAKEAIRILPNPPPWFTNVLAAAYREDNKIEKSISAATETLRRRSKDIEARTILCSDHVIAGALENARSIADEIVTIDPDFSLEGYARNQPFRDKATLKRLVNCLRKAGLPD